MKKLLLFSLFTLLASAMGWAATETWVKVTSQDDLTDGDYLIVYEKTQVAFDGSLTSITEKNTPVSVVISNESISIDDKYCFTIKSAAKSGEFTITSKSGLQIGAKEANKVHTGTDLTNTITLKSGNAVITSVQTSGGNNALQYNSSAKRFCYYTPKSKQQPIALYKKATKVAPLEIKPGFGTIEVDTKVTISCATKDAVLNGYVGEDTYVENAKLPYTFTASELGALKVEVYASKDGYEDSEVLTGTYIVKAAVPVAYRDVITADDYKETTSYTELNLEKNGATYSSKAYLKSDYLQFNNSNKQKAGIVMKESKAFVSKIIITWNESGAGFEIYGKNSPYDAAVDLYSDNTKGTLLGTYAWTKKGDVTEIDLTGKPFTFIGVKPTGLTYINSIEFIWNESEAGNADVTYTKASEAKAGNFAVLATADGKAVGRNADLSPVNVTVSESGDAIGLAKGQTAIDEFEIKENGNNYQLYGGLASNGSRHYLTYDDATGVTTVATADDNADVTFESKTAGLLVKFKDGQYLMFNGTKFIKADYGEPLTPVIVFMSSSNVSTGVETVEFDENVEAQYFNLNGVQVKAENLTPGLYIVRQGNKVSKQVIR